MYLNTVSDRKEHPDFIVNIFDSGPGRLTLKRHQIKRGINRHSGKMYARAENKKAEIVMVRTTKDGYRYFSHRTSSGRAWSGGWFAFLNWTNMRRIIDGDSAFEYFFKHDPTFIRSRMAQLTPVSLYEDSGHWNNIQYLPGGTTLMQCPPDEVVKRLFGKNNYRKDLMRTAAKTDFGYVFMQSLFRGHVPTERIIEAMQDAEGAVFFNREGPVFQGGFRGINEVRRKIIPKLSNRTLNALARRPTTFRDATIVEDIMRMNGWNGLFADLIEDGSLTGTTWNDIEEQILARYRVNRPQRTSRRTPQQIDPKLKVDSGLSGIFEKISGSAYRYVVPETTDQLREWGDYMHNCVSSYASQINSGRAVVVGICDGDTLIANAEVRYEFGRTDVVYLNQLLGKYNQPLPNDCASVIGNDLMSAGVRIDKSYIGNPGIR